MIPICWKYFYQIVEPVDETESCYKLVGCKICSDVVDYNTAQIHCPVIKEDKGAVP
jgi:hypothetical protein